MLILDVAMFVPEYSDRREVSQYYPLKGKDQAKFGG